MTGHPFADQVDDVLTPSDQVSTRSSRKRVTVLEGGAEYGRISWVDRIERTT